MYRHIDCALLALPAFEPLVNGLLSQPGLDSIQLHRLSLNEGADWAGDVSASAVYAADASHALLRIAPGLRRFDVCVLPVQPASLAWTRVALSNARAALPVPIVLWARKLTAPALRDLLILGAADFMLESASAEELKVRLAQWAGKGGAQVGAASKPGNAAQALPATRPRDSSAATESRPAPNDEAFARTLRQLSAAEPANDSFRATRAHMLAEFERDYVTSMLLRYRGNVTHAARAGNQDRRAFWQLMRKYRILSADFRNDYTPPKTQAMRAA